MNPLVSLAPAIALERLLPLVILSFGIGGLSFRRSALSIGLLGIGLLGGSFLPQLAIDHYFLPALFAISGLALIGKGEWARQLLPPAALAAGVVTGYWSAQLVSDLRLHLAVIAVVLATACAISLLARAVHRPWFTIPTRIVGSWFVAIGAIFAAVLLRPGNEPGANALTAVAPIPGHDSNLPHIHGPN